MPIEVHSLAEWEAAGIRGMLSVVIPAHNEEGNITETVQNLAAALRKADITYEILVINDGSRDDTAAILDRLAEEDARVRPYHVPAGEGGKGKSRALNLGRRVASGEVLAVYDADNFQIP